MEGPPAWLRTFLDRLAADDLSAATRRGYRYDLLQFIAWYIGLNSAPPELARLTEHYLITWRQHMMTQGGLKAASINRRLETVRRLLRWAETNGAVARNVALHVKSVRVVRERGPLGLTAAEVHGLLRAAGESSHGLARRNYALVQLCFRLACGSAKKISSMSGRCSAATSPRTGSTSQTAPCRPSSYRTGSKPDRRPTRHHLSKRSTWRAIRYRIKSQHCGRHTLLGLLS